jgi:hypothetical protein
MLFAKTFNQTPAYLSGVLILNLSLAAPLLAASQKTATVEPPPTSNSDENLAKNSPFADGAYLYGQSDKPEQIGKEYVVFQVRQGKVIGAFYLPQSEFSCFSGTVGARAMKLSVIDPYNNTVYPYAIALQQDSPIAAVNGEIAAAVGLEGYQRLAQLSNLDRHILGICLNQVE